MDPHQIKEIFTKNFDFQKVHSNPLVSIIATGLVNAEGDEWAKRRKIINPAFHLEKLKVIIYFSCSYLCMLNFMLGLGISIYIMPFHLAVNICRVSLLAFIAAYVACVLSVLQ